MITYTKEEALAATLDYFNGDALATNVFVTKYALKNKIGELVEKTPTDMHHRLAKEFARIEANYPNGLSEEEIFSHFDHFKEIVPQGSPMYGIGNDFANVSLSNCVVVASPKDSVSSIMNTGRDMANLFKRRCVEENTTVITLENGPMKIKDVEIGMSVLSFDINKKESVYRKVLNKFLTNVKKEDRIEIKLDSGAILKTSTKHPILTFSENYNYINGGIIKEKDVCIKPNHQTFDDSHMTKGEIDAGWFVGAHIGDGTCGAVRRNQGSSEKKYRFRFSGDNEEIVSEYARIFNQYSGSCANYAISYRKDYKVSVWEYANANIDNLKILSKYIDNQYGKKTYSAKTPKIIKEKNLWWPYIAGLIDTDGTISDHGIDIGICAKDIIDDVAGFLTGQGLMIHTSIRLPKKRNEKALYLLSIHCSKEFSLFFSKFLRHNKKREQFSKASKEFSRKKFLSEAEINEIYTTYKSRKSNTMGGAYSIIPLMNKSRMLGIGGLNELEKNNLISTKKKNEISQRTFVKTVSRDEISEIYYDIEVEETNNFFAGNFGLINIHNCGVGTDLSELRPEGMFVNNSAGTTTGAWSFAEYFSNIGRMIGQNGRRSAEMLSMDIRHPDIEKFVTMKYDLTKVTGANISVKITDDFMTAVERDDAFELRFPCESELPLLTKEIRARDLWKKIVDAATKTAEPGILMWDNILKFLPAECYKNKGFKHISTNPCAELPLSAEDSCRLMTLNLTGFIKNKFLNNSFFDFEYFSKVVAHAMRLQDDLVDLELEKLDKIIVSLDTEDEIAVYSKLRTSCANGRRTGLGTHGLADAIACLNLAYDSDEALVVIGKIYETLKNTAYFESTNLAKERGSFPVFEWYLEKDNLFIKSLPEYIRLAIMTNGRRNISILTNAPTGSVSILSQTSSGIEPVFRNTYTRRRKLSHNEFDTIADFTDVVGDKWSEYVVYHHNIQAYFKQFNTEIIPTFFTESDKIDWKQRVKIQGIITSHMDHSVSSTINLPKGTSQDTVSELYMLGWKMGLKGITVYVDGSRDGVLITDKKSVEFSQHEGARRPDELDCDIHNLTIRGEKWTVLIGLLNGKPYEVIGGANKLIDLNKSDKVGKILKVKLGKNQTRYDLLVGGHHIKDVVSVFDNANHSAFTRILSLSLRHGAKINYIVEQLQKEQDSDMFSFSRCIARVLKNYIEDGTKASGQKACGGCGTTNLIYQDGCVSCGERCGWSRCS